MGGTEGDEVLIAVSRNDSLPPAVVGRRRQGGGTFGIEPARAHIANDAIQQTGALRSTRNEVEAEGHEHARLPYTSFASVQEIAMQPLTHYIHLLGAHARDGQCLALLQNPEAQR